MLALRRLRILVYRSIKGYFDDGCSHRAAAIAYYVLFSIFPLVIFSVGVFGLVLQDAKLQADLVDRIMDSLPLSQEEGRDDVTEALEAVASDRSGAIGIIGLLALAWSGSAMFGVVRSSLNFVLDVQTPRPILLQKLLDLGFVVAVAPFFLGSIIATAALRFAQRTSEDLDFLDDLAHGMGAAWWLASATLPIVISCLAFFLVYWLVPARRIKAMYVVAGAVFAAILFEGVKVGFNVYLEHFSRYDLIFGSLGALVAFMFWVYLSASILLLGAEVLSELPAVMAGNFDAPQPSLAPSQPLSRKVQRFLLGLVVRPRTNGTEAGENPRRSDGT
jgi:membrane protein